jgi:hypothetical protein
MSLHATIQNNPWTEFKTFIIDLSVQKTSEFFSRTTSHNILKTDLFSFSSKTKTTRVIKIPTLKN